MRSISYPIIALILSASAFIQSASAVEPPGVINHQGRLTVAGVNHNGPAYFKFALVNASGNASYWSNDTTGVGGAEPSPGGGGILVTVANGHYAVPLGETGFHAKMTNGVPASVFENNDDVRLRIWVSTDDSTFTQLTPDRRITSSGYALHAAKAETVVDGAITSASIAAGAVNDTHLAPGTVAANLNASGQAGVTSGGVVLSADPNNAALLAAGYVKIESKLQAVTEDFWEPTNLIDAPDGRYDHTAVWTGTEMIIWGGRVGGAALDTGGRYNPDTDTWTPTNTVGAPEARYQHTVIWTGTEMIVWGGSSGGYLNSGGRYNPVTDTWTPMSETAAPQTRLDHTAIWTGTEMIVWGGDVSTFNTTNTGGHYDPVTDSWTATSGTGAPTARTRHTAVWTGSEMIVWGGASNSTNTGARYNPASNTWTATASSFLTARNRHTAIWTGTEMIIWGGEAGTFTRFADGARYNPTTNSWTATAAKGASVARSNHTAVWTGEEMILYGGDFPGSNAGSTGAIYDPLSEKLLEEWSDTTTLLGPFRSSHTAVWTGTKMIVWGGLGGGNLDSGGRYSLPVSHPTHLYLKP